MEACGKIGTIGVRAVSAKNLTVCGYCCSGAKLAPFNWGGGVSARIALRKLMMPCGKVDDAPPGHIPVKTCLKPTFFYQYRYNFGL